MLAYEDFGGDEEIDFDRVLEQEENKGDIINKFESKTVIGSKAFKKRLSPRPITANNNSSLRPASPNPS